MNTISHKSIRAKLSKGFTVLEYVLIFGLIALGAKLVYPSLTGIISDSKDTSAKSQAQFLAAAAAQYKTLTGTAIAGVAADPMTLVRANTILTQLAGPQVDQATGASKTIVETGFQFPTGTTFPTGWGESAAGIFEPIP